MKVKNLEDDSTHLVLGVLCKVVKGSYVQFEFPALAEFPKTRPERDEIWSGY